MTTQELGKVSKPSEQLMRILLTEQTERKGWKESEIPWQRCCSKLDELKTQLHELQQLDYTRAIETLYWNVTNKGKLYLLLLDTDNGRELESRIGSDDAYNSGLELFQNWSLSERKTVAAAAAADGAKEGKPPPPPPVKVSTDAFHLIVSHSEDDEFEYAETEEMKLTAGYFKVFRDKHDYPRAWLTRLDYGCVPHERSVGEASECILTFECILTLSHTATITETGFTVLEAQDAAAAELWSRVQARLREESLLLESQREKQQQRTKKKKKKQHAAKFQEDARAEAEQIGSMLTRVMLTSRDHDKTVSLTRKIYNTIVTQHAVAFTELLQETQPGGELESCVIRNGSNELREALNAMETEGWIMRKPGDTFIWNQKAPSAMTLARMLKNRA